MWQPLTPELELLLESVDPLQREWLTCTQRLTQELKRNLPNYQFKLLDQAWQDVSSNEKSLFDLTGQVVGGKVLVRSILHQSGEKTVVEGFSIIPEATVQLLSEALDNLAEKPLGDALLFENPEVTRSAFYFQVVNDAWQRGSVFFYRQEKETYPIMVIERFVEVRRK